MGLWKVQHWERTLFVLLVLKESMLSNLSPHSCVYHYWMTCCVGYCSFCCYCCSLYETASSWLWYSDDDMRNFLKILMSFVSSCHTYNVIYWQCYWGKIELLSFVQLFMKTLQVQHGICAPWFIVLLMI